MKLAFHVEHLKAVRRRRRFTWNTCPDGNTSFADYSSEGATTT